MPALLASHLLQYLLPSQPITPGQSVGHKSFWCFAFITSLIQSASLLQAVKVQMLNIASVKTPDMRANAYFFIVVSVTLAINV
jgi:hypothetical protein